MCDSEHSGTHGELKPLCISVTHEYFLQMPQILGLEIGCHIKYQIAFSGVIGPYSSVISGVISNISHNKPCLGNFHNFFLGIR